MIIAGIILIIIGIILCFLGYKLRQENIQRLRGLKDDIDKELVGKKSQLQEIEDKIKSCEEEYHEKVNENLHFLDSQSEIYNKRKEELNKQFQEYTEHLNKEYERYKIEIAEQKNKKYQEYIDYETEIDIQKQDCDNEINKIRNSLSAAVQAQLREKEKEEQLDFYRISIDKKDLEDIHLLIELKEKFHKPSVISKLIWTTYMQKKVSEMCSRVLKKDTVIGIYKITNIESQQSYIGQSNDISRRWKDHCKCGCDIDASATNKLYQDMIKNGIWNFTFELLEECPKSDLNEKEKFWINLYQSNIYGLNTTKGGS